MDGVILNIISVCVLQKLSHWVKYFVYKVVV
jgi:hypothetical protein